VPRHPRPAPTRRRRTRARRRGTRSALRAAGAVLFLCVLLAYAAPVRGALTGAGEALVEAAGAGRRAALREGMLVRYALRHGISFELAAAIERAAVAEGIDPDLAFRLVRVESEFHPRAVSPAGALGLTQLMPPTAAELQPGITREQIFERDTNLRLGFRYLHWLLRLYDGDVEEALHAYNRGPGTVQRIRAAGGDPANGYAERVLGRTPSSRYRGTGFLPEVHPAAIGF
jgi:soluble lytic murein transglycosylase-like protein